MIFLYELYPYSLDIYSLLHVRKWTSYVKAFESYRLTMRETDRQNRNYIQRCFASDQEQIRMPLQPVGQLSRQYYDICKKIAGQCTLMFSCVGLTWRRRRRFSASGQNRNRYRNCRASFRRWRAVSSPRVWRETPPNVRRRHSCWDTVLLRVGGGPARPAVELDHTVTTHARDVLEAWA